MLRVLALAILAVQTLRERRVGAALTKFLECRLLGVCCGISTFDETHEY